MELKEKGKTIILASHNQQDIDALCDAVYEMNAGRLTRCAEERGNPAQPQKSASQRNGAQVVKNFKSARGLKPSFALRALTNPQTQKLP